MNNNISNEMKQQMIKEIQQVKGAINCINEFCSQYPYTPYLVSPQREYLQGNTYRYKHELYMESVVNGFKKVLIGQGEGQNQRVSKSQAHEMGLAYIIGLNDFLDYMIKTRDKFSQEFSNTLEIITESNGYLQDEQINVNKELQQQIFEAMVNYGSSKVLDDFMVQYKFKMTNNICQFDSQDYLFKTRYSIKLINKDVSSTGQGINKKMSKQESLDEMIRILMRENNMFKRFSMKFFKKIDKNKSSYYEQLNQQNNLDQLDISQINQIKESEQMNMTELQEFIKDDQQNNRQNSQQNNKQSDQQNNKENDQLNSKQNDQYEKQKSTDLQVPNPSMNDFVGRIFVQDPIHFQKIVDEECQISQELMKCFQGYDSKYQTIIKNHQQIIEFLYKFNFQTSFCGSFIQTLHLKQNVVDVKVFHQQITNNDKLLFVFENSLDYKAMEQIAFQKKLQLCQVNVLKNDYYCIKVQIDECIWIRYLFTLDRNQFMFSKLNWEYKTKILEKYKEDDVIYTSLICFLNVVSLSRKQMFYIDFLHVFNQEYLFEYPALFIIDKYLEEIMETNRKYQGNLNFLQICCELLMKYIQQFKWFYIHKLVNDESFIQIYKKQIDQNLMLQFNKMLYSFYFKIQDLLEKQDEKSLNELLFKYYNNDVIGEQSENN